MLGCAAWLRWRLWRRPIMNPRRFATVAPALCGTVVLAGWIVGWLAGFGSAGIKNTGAVPIENRAASLAANARLADEPQAIPMAMGSAVVANTVVANTVVANAAVASAEVATAAEPAAGAATPPKVAPGKPETIVTCPCYPPA